MANTSSSSFARLTLGILLTVLAFLAVAVMSALAKAASETGLSAQVLTFFQNFISLLLLLPWVLHDGIANLKTHHWGLHFVRAITGLLSQYLMFAALKYIPLVDAVLLANAAPLFIPLVALVWLKTRISGRLWISLLIGFVGIVLILQPGGEVLNWATLLALVAGIFSAMALVAVGRLDLTEPSARILFYYFLISSVLTAPLLLTNWTQPQGIAWLWLVGIGITMAVAQFLLILAYNQASAAQLSPFNYSVVVFSGLIGWLIWNETPNAPAFFGVVLVCVGGVLASIQHHRASVAFPAVSKPAVTT